MESLEHGIQVAIITELQVTQVQLWPRHQTEDDTVSCSQKVGVSHKIFYVIKNVLVYFMHGVLYGF